MSKGNSGILSKFQTKVDFLSTGVVNVGDVEVLKEISVRVKINNVASTNVVVVSARLATEQAWTSIYTLSGSVNQVLDVSTWDYIKFDCTTYAADGDPELVASGFFSDTVVSGLSPDGTPVSAPLSGKDTGNSTTTNLGAAESFIGAYKNTTGYASGVFFAISSAQLTDIKLQYSPDGINANTGLLSTSDMTVTEVETGGFYIYLLVVTTFVDTYYRIEATNGATPTVLLEIDSWLYDSPYTGSYGTLDDTLSTFSLAQLTRSVGAGVDPDGNFVNSLQSGIFTAGSTSTPLLAGGEFIGEWLDVSRYAQIYTFISADVPFDDTAYTDTFGATAGIVLDIRSGDSGGPDFTFDIPTLTNPPNHAFKQKPVLKWARIRYTNGDTDQGAFTIALNAEVTPSLSAISLIGAGLSGTDLAQATASAIFGQDRVDDQFKTIPMIPAGAVIDNSMDTVIVKSVQVAEDVSGDYGRIERIGNSQKVVNTEDVQDRPCTKLDVGQLVVPSGVVTILPRSSRMNIQRSVSLTNPDDTNNLYFSHSATMTTINSDVILPLSTKDIELGDDSLNTATGDRIYLQSGGAIATTQTDTLDADTVDSSSGLTTQSNLFVSDDTRTIFDNVADTVTLSGFDGTAASFLGTIQSVKLVLEGRKEPSAGNELIALIDVVGQDSGNVTSITSPTVTANDDHFYIVSVARRDEFATITTVSSTMGFDSFTLINDTSTDSAESRTSRYYGVATSALTDGTITASFSQGADHCVISVERYSNVDKTDPILDSQAFGANNSGGAYSGTLTDSSQGGYYSLAVGLEQATHTSGTLPSGATESFEDGSTIGNDQIMAIVTAPFTTSGSKPFSGTVITNNDISYVAVSLKPVVAKTPTIEVSHSEGSTVLSATLTSESDTTYEADITSDTTWTGGIVDAMTLTISPTEVGVADAEVDHVYVEVVSTSSSIRVHYSIVGSDV